MRRIAGTLTTAGCLIAFVAACSRPGTPPAPERTSGIQTEAAVLTHPSEAGEQVLQPVIGYSAGPLTVGDNWLRRTYSRTGATIEVTIAGRDLRPEEYEDWYQQSRHYPTARLPFPTDRSSGFFTCAGEGGAPPCDLHGQTRAGTHIEAHGTGAATGAEMEGLLALLAWK